MVLVFGSSKLSETPAAGSIPPSLEWPGRDDLQYHLFTLSPLDSFVHLQIVAWRRNDGRQSGERKKETKRERERKLVKRTLVIEGR